MKHVSTQMSDPSIVSGDVERARPQNYNEFHTEIAKQAKFIKTKKVLDYNHRLF